MKRPTARTTESTIALIVRAIGGPRQAGGKLVRLVATARIFADRGELSQRMDQLALRGFISQRPSRVQLAFGALDMLRFVIVPAAQDFYDQQGIDFRFHQLLRFLDDPVSIVDPTGLFSHRDTIIGHLMQVVHLNPVYDLELLQMFPDGLEELERQVEQMLAGSHPRASTIAAIVEDDEYHARLLEYVQRYRNDASTAHLIREQTLRSEDESFAQAERTFATLPGFIDYCAALPDSVPQLIRRYRKTRRFVPMT
jgi:hypothetical protein